MPAELLRINLIPESAKKAGSTSVEQLHRAPLMWIGAGVLLVVPVLMVLPMQLRRAHLNRMTAKLAELQPDLLQTQRLQRQVELLRAQDDAFRRLGTGGELWAKRLNVLSDATPAGLWFTELSLDRDKGLVIQGSAVQQGEQEMVSITRLVQSLKSDPDFSSTVQDIQIESIKRVQDGELEVVLFTLTCTFRPVAGT